MVTQNSTRVVNVRSMALAFLALALLMAGLLAVSWISATSSIRSVTPTQAVPAGAGSGAAHARTHFIPVRPGSAPSLATPAKPQHYS